MQIYLLILKTDPNMRHRRHTFLRTWHKEASDIFHTSICPNWHANIFANTENWLKYCHANILICEYQTLTQILSSIYIFTNILTQILSYKYIYLQIYWPKYCRANIYICENWKLTQILSCKYIYICENWPKYLPLPHLRPTIKAKEEGS